MSHPKVGILDENLQPISNGNPLPVEVIGTTVFATRIDEASATVTYVGKAATGTATSSALWQVQKIDTSSGTVITWADGNGLFDNIWDNRATLSYS